MKQAIEPYEHYKGFPEKYQDILDLSYGFECGQGWEHLIDTVLSLCLQHKQASSTLNDFQFVQIKEKFGGLRMYYVNADSYIRGAVSLAESLSYNICDTCGAPGKTANSNSWLRATCELHK